MKKMALLFFSAAVAASASAQNNTSLATAQLTPGTQASQEVKTRGKVLVAYFSATGTTERVASMIAEATDGQLYEIRPAVQYSSADLDWTDKGSRSSEEMNDSGSRPEIVADLKDAGSFTTIYLGYPIWWDLAPRVVNTFIEKYGFNGKTVIPFATSGGSSITNSVKVLRETYPDIDWKDGRLLNGASQKTIDSWTGK